MRFGQSYHRYFVPEWSDQYVDYNRLKKNIKLRNVSSKQIVRLNPAPAHLSNHKNNLIIEIYEHLDATLIDLDIFYENVHLSLSEGSLANADTLRWFERLNTDAISRILAKVQRYGLAITPQWDDFQSKWNALQSTFMNRFVNLKTELGDCNGLVASQLKPTNPLHLAIRRHEGDIAPLADNLDNLRFISVRGETALHVATQHGQLATTILLLEQLKSKGLGHDIPDTSRGWTPLFFAAVDGHFEIVRHLLEAGSDQGRKDDLGWTAKEYSVFKGHLAVADLFEETDVDELTGGPERSPFVAPVPAPTYCTAGERIIIATLGTARKDKIVTEVDLSFCSSVYSSGKFSDVASFFLEVSALGTDAEPRTVQLPIVEDQINDPFVFPIPLDTAAQLMFNVNQNTDEGTVVVGSGTAMLDDNTQHFGAGRQSLIRELTIPIFDKASLITVGTVTFTFLIAKPFLKELRGAQGFSGPEEWKEALSQGPSAVLVGHRGTGQNRRTRRHLQIGENTVGSFLSAAKLGATFVEFDVQVTRDLQAIAFHDFSLSESGTDIPVHDLTLDQFLYASKIQSPHGNPLSVLGKPRYRDDGRRPRSRSLGEQFEAGAIQIRDRMKHTVDFKNKGFKPNTRGDFIQDSFATLKDILTQLPEDIGLDIEIKYPRLHEALDAGVAPVAIELNTFVDVALETIRQYSKPGCHRKIILSSFTPEVCILLSLKQKAYPVFFITNAGKVPMSDMEVRAASVQVAVRFARRWNLTGIVFACEALLLSPRLVGYVKNKGGLVCATYGDLNNHPDEVRKQVSSGVDIIVADRVRLVADTLTVLN